jgi:type VI secretion system secreted protein VgrG
LEGGGFARYRLIIEPWLAFLGHTQDNTLSVKRPWR